MKMQSPWRIENIDLEGLQRLAERVALIVCPGDMITLKGDLGTGKTTFARALICALLEAGESEDIPSPTFSLVQTYQTPRMEVCHFDLYRLGNPSEVGELGLGDRGAGELALVEWPEHAGDYLPAERFEILFGDGSEEQLRTLEFSAEGSLGQRLCRLRKICDFLERAGWQHAKGRYLQGDASTRRYARFELEGEKAVLMDWPGAPDGPLIKDGKSYSGLAYLAENVRVFVAVGRVLGTLGVRVPDLKSYDFENGFLLLEDLGSRMFGAEIAKGENVEALYHLAIDLLVDLRQKSPEKKLPLPDGSIYVLPPYDVQALSIEIELVGDWLWPALHKEKITEAAKEDFSALWQPLFEKLTRHSEHWVLRDFHSPNLLICEGEGRAQLGVIDFQDAVRGHPAYDLVSLLQDARQTVSPEVEARGLDHYCISCEVHDPAFDRADFKLAYAILGAQRNSKILGIFARLALRDRKFSYLKHLPRIWDYLERNLAHPELAEIKLWYERHFSPHMRRKIPDIDIPDET